MGGSSSSGATSETKTTRYAPYIEERHIAFLAIVSASRQSVISDSPFEGYTDVDADDAFFGAGVSLSSLPSMYESFWAVAALDIASVWDNIVTQKLSSQELSDAVEKSVRELDDRIETEVIPEFLLGMRNQNAVCSSSFVVGLAVIEDSRVKQAMAIKLSAKTEALGETPRIFSDTLNSKSDTVKQHAAMIKEYLVWKIDADDANYTAAVQHNLWPFTVLSFEGAALGTMQSTQSWQKTAATRDRSTVSKGLLVASYTATGAYVGSTVPVVGTLVGGVVGFVVGIAAALF